MALRRVVSADARRFASQTHLEDLRSKAERAWRTRNYAAVVDALEEVGVARSDAENARLRYARKHLSLE
jgi:hypothetical protein